jgi:hypothetical protein
MENFFEKIPGFATYIVIGFGGVCILSCGYHIIKKICRRREDNARLFQELEIMGGQIEEVVPKSKKIIQTVVEELANDVNEIIVSNTKVKISVFFIFLNLKSGLKIPVRIKVIILLTSYIANFIHNYLIQNNC